jgi:hypothetical protein
MRRWESLPTLTQAAVAFPLLGFLLFFVNLSVFAQPVWRSILYGIIEGAVLTILLLVATNTERRKRDPRN